MKNYKWEKRMLWLTAMAAVVLAGTARGSEERQALIRNQKSLAVKLFVSNKPAELIGRGSSGNLVEQLLKKQSTAYHTETELKTEIETETEAETETEQPSVSYTASAFGYDGGRVTVTVTIAPDGTMENVEILDCSSQTPEIGQVAAPAAAERIVREQSTEVDAVTGATETCEAVKNAVKTAIVMAEKARNRQ